MSARLAHHVNEVAGQLVGVAQNHPTAALFEI
jgi:hypothetical protein